MNKKKSSLLREHLLVIGTMALLYGARFSNGLNDYVQVTIVGGAMSLFILSMVKLMNES